MYNEKRGEDDGFFFKRDWYRTFKEMAVESKWRRLGWDVYKRQGVGMFGLNKAFRIATSHENYVELKPINNMDEVILDDLVGYEIQKKKLLDNTVAFIEEMCIRDRFYSCLL